MSDVVTKKYTNIIPDDCRHLVNKEALALLDENDVFIEVEQTPYFMLVHGFPFAGVYDVIPFVYENSEARGVTYTNIRNTERSDDIDNTAKAVLTRLGHNPEDYFYWPVYLVETDCVDSDYTKLFSADEQDAEKGVFAGFGYQHKTEIGDESYNEWEAEQKSALLYALGGVQAQLNDLIVYVALRDGCDGMKICEFEVFKNNKALNWRINNHFEGYVKNYRQRKDYARLKAERKIEGHIIPSEYQHLISDETKQFVIDRGMFMKITKDDRSTGRLHSFKFFSKKELLDKVDITDPYSPEFVIEAIEEHELAETAAAVAKNLLARVQGDESTTTWWPIYLVEKKCESGDKWSVVVAAAETSTLDAHGELVGIAFGYNHNLDPTVDGNEEIRKEKSGKLDAWKASKHNSIKIWASRVELALNERVIHVYFYTPKYGDPVFGAWIKELAAQDDFDLKIREAVASELAKPAIEAAWIAEHLATP